MENVFFDYTGAKNETAAKNAARADLTVLFYNFLVERFGKENVGMIDKNTIGFYCGTVIDKDGCPVYVPATVKPVIKNYNEHIGTKRASKAFDLDDAIAHFATYGTAAEAD